MADGKNIYSLSRAWFDFSFENPELVKPNHTALYFFCIEHCNRLGWKEKFGLPTTMAKEAIGIKSYNTYKNTLHDLVDWKFIIMIELSKNQYSANIIALSYFNKALDNALDKALIKHGTKQSESTEQSIGSIDKQYTKEQIYKLTKYKSEIVSFLDSLEVENKDERIDYSALIKVFHELCPRLPKVVSLTDKRKRTIRARIKEHGKQSVKDVLSKLGKSPFHNGENDRAWTATFDWIMKPDNFITMLERQDVAGVTEQQISIQKRIDEFNQKKRHARR